MSAPSPSTAESKLDLFETLKPFMAPYYVMVAAVLGAITFGFVVVVAVMVLVATNFNLLGWIE